MGRQKIVLRIVAGVLLAGILIVQIPSFKRNAQYQKAEKLYSAGEFTEAQEVFGVLGDYKDAPEMGLECQYQNAELKLTAKQYSEAKLLYKALKAYKDSSEKVKECDYQFACDLFEKQEYMDALDVFSDLNHYSNSEEYRIECINKLNENNYQLACSLLAEKDYEKAIEIFSSLNDYADSRKKETECLYQLACQLLEQKQYDVALQHFNSLGDYKSSQDYVEECKIGAYISSAELDQTVNQQLRQILSPKAAEAYLPILKQDAMSYVEDWGNLANRAAFIYDLDGDGFAELVVNHLNEVRVYSFVDGELICQINCEFIDWDESSGFGWASVTNADESPVLVTYAYIEGPHSEKNVEKRYTVYGSNFTPKTVLVEKTVDNSPEKLFIDPDIVYFKNNQSISESQFHTEMQKYGIEGEKDIYNSQDIILSEQIVQLEAIAEG